MSHFRNENFKNIIRTKSDFAHWYIFCVVVRFSRLLDSIDKTDGCQTMLMIIGLIVIS